jgi:hypothetical protein
MRTRAHGCEDGRNSVPGKGHALFLVTAKRLKANLTLEPEFLEENAR